MESNTMNISKDDLQEMLRTLIKAAKEPTEDQAIKLKEEKARYEKSRSQAIQQQEAERRAKEQRQNNCTHKKENGKWATGGQVIGGRYGLLVCQHCQRTWYTRFSQETIQSINAGDLTLHQNSPEGWQDEVPMEEVATA